ncbi:MAG: phosphodiesterase [Gammaproteobacteria bacterium]|nr:phosphodiesterase [Gammaproteobacteria bacterium]NVK86897.1 phosphodiesterase [Gammaproteobacteria bacterium]
MKHWLVILALASTALSPLAYSAAESQSQTVATPRHGQDMESVRAQFGEPQQKVPAVGEPPITRWIYGQFTVYFEHDKVIHSVQHHS